MIKMKRSLIAGLLFAYMLSFEAVADEQSESEVGRFADLALECVHQEYPNKISHVLSGDQDVGSPRELTPVFYGCFDWHSSAHGHWLLTRLLRLYPQAEFSGPAETALNESFKADKVALEVVYVKHPQRASFERPYGVAWLLQLTAELREWDDSRAQRWLKALEPLEAALVANMESWLVKLAYPIRVGEHAQTAFAFGLFLDWARASERSDFTDLVSGKATEFYLNDRSCPMAYEPGGQDFLSPCLAEADLMRRVLDKQAYARWLTGFMPSIPVDGRDDWLQLAVVTDPTDGKLAHLDGLNISRAWMLEGMASGLPAEDPRLGALLGSAAMHKKSGLASVTGEHYEGGHWLGSFATYLQTSRGLENNGH